MYYFVTSMCKKYLAIVRFYWTRGTWTRMSIKYRSCSLFRSRFILCAMFCPHCTTYKRGARISMFWLSAHKILLHFIGQNAFGVFWTGERNTPLDISQHVPGTLHLLEVEQMFCTWRPGSWPTLGNPGNLSRSQVKHVYWIFFWE
jgi:hypothetical protein